MLSPCDGDAYDVKIGPLDVVRRGAGNRHLEVLASNMMTINVVNSFRSSFCGFILDEAISHGSIVVQVLDYLVVHHMPILREDAEQFIIIKIRWQVIHNYITARGRVIGGVLPGCKVIEK
jgi:hypothetical protein